MILSPGERTRAGQFAVALDGGPVGDTALALMLRVAKALGTAGGAVGAAAPAEEFKAALRQRLLAGAAVPRVPRQGVAVTPARWRKLVAASTVVAVATAGTAGTAAASGSALPGERLYGVKRTVESVQLALATSDMGRGERHLVIAEERLTEVEGLLDVAGPRSRDPVMVEHLRKALGDMSSSVEMARARFIHAYDRTGDAQVLLPLVDSTLQLGQELRTLTALLPWQLIPDQAALVASLDAMAARLSGGTDPASSGQAGTAADEVGATSDRAKAPTGSGGGGVPEAPQVPVPEAPQVPVPEAPQVPVPDAPQIPVPDVPQVPVPDADSGSLLGVIQVPVPGDGVDLSAVGAVGIGLDLSGAGG